MIKVSVLIVSLGVASIVATSFHIDHAHGQASFQSSMAIQSTPEPHVGDKSGPTPTIDRLSAPPTVFPPTQADDGAQVFWLNCQPCHGDQGQGLTDEWRSQYPPEHQDCWTSGCHGKRPYEEGFTLPDSVPPVIDYDSLTRFDSLGQLYDFMRASMPMQARGVLSDEEYLSITAFLGRAHGAWEGVRPLDIGMIYNIPLRPTADDWSPVLFGGIVIFVLLVGGLGLLRRRAP